MSGYCFKCGKKQITIWVRPRNPKDRINIMDGATGIPDDTYTPALVCPNLHDIDMEFYEQLVKKESMK